MTRRLHRLSTLALLGTVLLIGAAAAAAGAGERSRRPNVVVILADDLGYGDVGCYNPDRGKIATPRLDRLAREGMRFTDAHSSSAVCSPSRYTLLTGRYHWRTRLQSGVINEFGQPLIAPGRLTLAGLLKKSGYRTACVGKWHLGWDWPIGRGQMPALRLPASRGNLDAVATEEQRAVWQEVFSKPIGGGPAARGFDTYFGTDIPNWPPYCFIENDRTVGIPSELLPARLVRQGGVPGPAVKNWSFEAILPALADRACEFITASTGQRQPFFLYLPLTSPHTPLAVNQEWRGRSGLGPYADFVMETDAVVGRVLDALEKSGAAKNTLVLFSSDNGCAPYMAPGLEKKGHFPNGPLRGYKYDVWEGGHRVPFIVRWPGVVKPGTRCDRLVLQADLMASCADLLGKALPANAGEDSVSLLPLLQGQDRPVREAGVHHSAQGLFAIRRGPWKLILGRGSGGRTPGADDQPGQLYHLATDPAEMTNRYAEKPEVVAELTALLERYVADGRSTPGPKQQNDVAVKWKEKLAASGG